VKNRKRTPSIHWHRQGWDRHQSRRWQGLENHFKPSTHGAKREGRRTLDVLDTKRKRAFGVLEEDCAGRADLADDLVVVGLDAEETAC
jgi:hypothetical protein